MSREHDDEDSYGLFGHHDAKFNAEQVLRNLILIQEHYAVDSCSDCLSKHWNLVLAYAEEGLTLDNYKEVKDLLEKATKIANRHLKIIIECSTENKCRVKNDDDMMRMLQEVRSLRKEISMRIYGLVGDVTHDAFDVRDARGKMMGLVLHDEMVNGMAGDIDEHIHLEER